MDHLHARRARRPESRIAESSLELSGALATRREANSLSRAKRPTCNARLVEPDNLPRKSPIKARARALLVAVLIIRYTE